MAYIGQVPVSGDNSFRILDDITSYTLTFDGSSSSVVSTTNYTITQINHRFVTAQRVTYTHGGGTAIGGLTSGTAYFIIKVDQNTIKLATSAVNANNNAAIDLNALGTGTSHTLNVAFDSVNTKFKATYNNGTKAELTRAAQLQISINGVIQQPQDSIAPVNGFGLENDSTIVFSTAPSSTDVFWGNVIANSYPTFDVSDNTVDTFTGTGSQTNFSLSKTPANNQNVLVTINGVVQYPSDATTSRSYSVDANVLTFTSAPAGGSIIQVRHIGFAGATSSAVTGFYGRTGNVGLTTADNVVIGTATIGVGAAGTSLLVQGNTRVTGILTVGSSSVTLDGNNNQVNVGSGVTITNSGFLIGASNLHSGGLTATSINVSGVGTFASLVVSGNVSIAGTVTYDDVTNVDSIGIVTARTGVRITDGGLVVTAGVSTFSVGPVLIGSGTSTGTASQPLQVTGGAYVSGNVGIGTTLPSSGTLEIAKQQNFIWRALEVKNTGTSGITLGSNIRLHAYDGSSIAPLGGLIVSGSTWNYGTYLPNQFSIVSTGSGGVAIAASIAPIIFRNGNADIDNSPERARFDASGNLGIGLTNPVGQLQVASGPVIIGAATSTGTATQRLQVTGGAYVSGNLGIGTTNPSGATVDIFAGGTTSGFSLLRISNLADGATAGFLGLQKFGSAATSYGPYSANNVGIDAAFTQFNLGTQTGHPLTLYTNNTERVRIDSSGNVGLGTTSPISNLHINSTTARSIVFTGDTGSSYLVMGNKDSGGTTGPSIIQSANRNLTFGVGDSFTNSTGGTYTEYMRLNSNGNLGIGTINPDTNLHIQRSSAQNDTHGILKIESTNPTQAANTNSSLIVKNKFGWSQFMQWENFGVRVGCRSTTGGGSGDVYLTSGNDSVAMVIKSSGNTGIGTTNPQAPLHVVGTGATTLIVAGNARVTGILSVGQGTITINGNTDKITVPKLDYAGISSTISDTVVDVFVYDTRKDSDGGAWRKRTQHTSWYNETLNTATRGSRKDFPAVAVIVSTLTTVTIYDGDDPDMPMWMVFEGATVGASGMAGTRMLQYASQQGYFVHALNGILVIGQKTNSDNYGSPIIRFISEYVNRMDPQTGTEGGVWNGSIADRNTTAGYRVSSTETYGIVNSIINDVAMTVLPNAPIDSTTGLPVPTIAVATKGGISIITDSGTVYNLTPESEPAYASIKNFFSVGFDSNQKPFFTDTQTGSGYSQLIYLPNYTYNQSLSDTYSYLSGSYNYAWDSYTRTTTTTVGYWAPSNNLRLIRPSVATRDSIAIGYTGPGLGGEGLSLIGQQDNYLMNCGITTTFNTGWLYGYTQGAFLSDINATNVTGTELVTNGTFASGTTGWSSSNGGSLSVVSGALRINANGNAYGGATQTLPTLVVGKTYVLSVDIGTISNASAFSVIVRDSVGNVGVAFPTSNQKTSIYFTARQASGTYILFESPADSDAICDIDNVSVRITEADRSINDKGLAVYGTITKTAVATDADLVSYSGIGTTSFLEQPYNNSAASFDFGTGNFSIMGWINTQNVGGGQFIFYRSTNSTLREFELWIAADLGYMSIYLGGTGLNTPNYVIPNSTWTHFCALRNSGGVVQIYINGVSVVSGNITSNVNTTNPAKILWNCDTGTKLSLLRISGSVPTTDQIKKIYNDEKALFQINSKAVLYGTSSAVTALAYDDSTKLLHVGTSSGRSEFQGLERINNTTTAVTTAISASNGLVAEQ